MKKYLLSTLILLFMLSNVSFAAGTPDDFTGESYFKAPISNLNDTPKAKKDDTSGTIPPLKLLRLKTRAFFAGSEARKEARAKRKAIKQALKAYKKNKVLEDATLVDVPTDKDIEHLEMAGVEESKSPQRIIITCDDMDYSTETAILNGNGNVVVKFVQENTTLKTDHIVYDKKSNRMSAIGNVIINKQGVDVYGDSINVDLNEENALIDHPLSKFSEISISAEKGYVYQNKVIQEKGTITVEGNYPLVFEPSGKAPQLSRMMIGDDRSVMDDYIGNSDYKIKVSSIIINSDKKLESIELRKAQIYRGNKRVFMLPWIRLYTNKNHDFVDGDFPELGSRRNLGMYIGPGWAIKLPFGSLLKVAPIATYRNKFGIGGFARFLSGTNQTELAYGTSKSRFVLRGDQKLDDHLKLQYAIYDHMDNWFLGRRMPKYGAELVYSRAYDKKNFLYKNLDLKFTHQASFGLFRDNDEDKYFNRLNKFGKGHGTVRMRYMAEVNQKLFKYENKEKLTAVWLSIIGQGSTALYGSGETQVIGRIGPRLHTQYKRWVQDLGYYQTAYDDNTPMPVFDAYRYGKSNVYVREYLRVHRLLTLSWFGSLTLSDDRYRNNRFSECAFFVSIGPDDLKLNVGYDVIRENAYVNFSVALDPKDMQIDYDRMTIKNPENFNFKKKDGFFAVSNPPNEEKPDKKETSGILKNAIVEEISDIEDNSDEEL